MMVLTSEQKILLGKNVIELRGEVDDVMSTYVRDCLSILKCGDDPDIEVWITSPGGDLIDGLDIHDMFQCYPGQVTGRVINQALSIATVILQGCDRRLAQPNARLLIHEPVISNLSVTALRNQMKMQKSLEKAGRRLYDRIYRILSARSGLHLTEIRRLCKKGDEMFADEALSMGLLDEIV